jgi:hypothetical protein
MRQCIGLLLLLGLPVLLLVMGPWLMFAIAHVAGEPVRLLVLAACVLLLGGGMILGWRLLDLG